MDFSYCINIGSLIITHVPQKCFMLITGKTVQGVGGVTWELYYLLNFSVNLKLWGKYLLRIK